MKDTTKQLVEIFNRYDCGDCYTIYHEGLDDENIIYDQSKISMECNDEIESYIENPEPSDYSYDKDTGMVKLHAELMEEEKKGLVIVEGGGAPHGFDTPYPENLVVESRSYIIEVPTDGQNHGEVLGGLIDEANQTVTDKDIIEFGEQLGNAIREQSKTGDEQLSIEEHKAQIERFENEKWLRSQGRRVVKRLRSGLTNATPSRISVKKKRKQQSKSRKKNR